MSELADKQKVLSNTDEVSNLDVLRATAVSSVFFAHLYNFVHPGYSQTAWHFGQLGVLMFFVHTALVLMFSLERQEAEGLPLFSAFYIRRWFRLYPLSIFFVTLVYIISKVYSGDPAIPHWTLLDFLANLSLTQNLLRRSDMIGVLWTLPLEVQMYVTLPFLYVFLIRKNWMWVIGLLLVSVPLAFIAINITDRLSLLEYVPCFLGGILAWKLSRRYQPILSPWLWPVGLACASLIWFQADNIPPYHLYLRWTFCAVLGALIPMFRSMGSSFFTRFAAIVAKYSYGIYLSHILILNLAFRTLDHQSRIIQWSTFVVLAVAVPVAVYHLLEAPMIRVGRRCQRLWGRSRSPEQMAAIRVTV